MTLDSGPRATPCRPYVPAIIDEPPQNLKRSAASQCAVSRGVRSNAGRTAAEENAGGDSGEEEGGSAGDERAPRAGDPGEHARREGPEQEGGVDDGLRGGDDPASKGVGGRVLEQR